jgi:transcriptional regulator with XRE-family HTH domain
MSIDKSENVGKILAQRVLLSRRDLHWRQEDLAEASGVSRGHISNVERGYTKNVGLDSILSIAEALKVSVFYLMGKTDDPLGGLPATDEEDESVIRAEITQPTTRLLAKRLIDLFVTMPRRDQDLLLSFAQAMAVADKAHIIGEEVDGGTQR